MSERKREGERVATFRVLNPEVKRARELFRKRTKDSDVSPGVRKRLSVNSRAEKRNFMSRIQGAVESKGGVLESIVAVYKDYFFYFKFVFEYFVI